MKTFTIIIDQKWTKIVVQYSGDKGTYEKIKKRVKPGQVENHIPVWGSNSWQSEACSTTVLNKPGNLVKSR